MPLQETRMNSHEFARRDPSFLGHYLPSRLWTGLYRLWTAVQSSHKVGADFTASAVLAGLEDVGSLPKIRREARPFLKLCNPNQGYHFRGPHNKDYSILGSILDPLI